MSQADTKQISHIVMFAALFCAVVATIGCGGAISSSHSQSNGDPLHLGVIPGPLGSPIPQTIEVGLGSEPNDRIVSLSLTISSLQATNSGSENLELLTAPVTVEFTRSATVTAPIVVRDIYQDTYSALVFPSMTGQVVFYDSNGQLTTQSLNLAGGTVALNPNLVLAVTPDVLSVSLDLAQTFTVGTNLVTANPIVVTVSNSMPLPPVAPAVGQPETGSISFLIGTVTAVDTGTQTISIQPTSGNATQLSYDNTTEFIGCDPAILTGMMIETEDATKSSGAVLATRVALIQHSASSSELYGLLAGPAPDFINYNLIVEGGAGLNVSTALFGKNVTVDWLAASYSVNSWRLDMSGSQDLVFDEGRTFPGQFVAVQWGALIVPDPDSSNAGYLQPGMIELQEQTISGDVSNYVFDAVNQTGTFTLNVAGSAPIRILNAGLISITVRQTLQTYLRNAPTFANGDPVKVRGLLFVDPNYSNANYKPPDPVAFIMVADRISK
jgi:hypothetical protein